MHDHNAVAALVLNRAYEVEYMDGGDQVQKIKGTLVSTDHDGFVVLEAEGRTLLVAKDRVVTMREVVQGAGRLP